MLIYLNNTPKIGRDMIFGGVIMKTITEQAKEIPIYDEVDVAVVGSGPAGFGAAYRAAASGLKTIVIEQMGDIGGISTSGLMSHWTGNCDNSVYNMILDESARLNEGEQKNKRTIYIDPEKLKTLYLELLTDVGCEILLYTFFSDVIMEGNAVKGIIIQNKSGRQAIMAKTVIDATGDGDVAYRAGAEYILGRETDSKMQPATIMFKVGGVDTDRAVFPGSFETTVDTNKGELQALASEKLPKPAGHVLLYESTLPGIATCNMTNCIDVDGTNAADLTKATITCRKQMDAIVDFLREYVPGYEKCFIISSASLIGIRETRHFKGVKSLNEHDIWEARVYEDAVVKDAYFSFDVHNMSGSGLDATGVQKHFTQRKGYTIPYGCLVPEKIDNLLLSGRNISGTHLAHSSFRVMPICVATGEAAAAAAAIAKQKNISVRDVEPKDIQEFLGLKF